MEFWVTCFLSGSKGVTIRMYLEVESENQTSTVTATEMCQELREVRLSLLAMIGWSHMHIADCVQVGTHWWCIQCAHLRQGRQTRCRHLICACVLMAFQNLCIDQIYERAQREFGASDKCIIIKLCSKWFWFNWYQLIIMIDHCAKVRFASFSIESDRGFDMIILV